MSRFRIPGGPTIDRLCCDNAPRADGARKTIHLEYSGVDEITSGGVFLDVSSKSDKARRVTPFTVQPKLGAIGKAFVYSVAGGDNDLLPVKVGKVTNHANFAVDLFAELGRSEDPRKLSVYQRALDPVNNALPDSRDTWDSRLADQPLKQITDPHTPSKWNCGAALSDFGTKYFKRIDSSEATLYYNKPKSGERADIFNAINAAKLRAGVDKIRALLRHQTAVRVFVSHHYPVKLNGARVSPTGHTHYLSIIGFGEVNRKQRFLYIDPWPAGSKLTYNSGIFGDVNSIFMGQLEYDADVLQTPPSATFNQSHDYLVLAGP